MTVSTLIAPEFYKLLISPRVYWAGRPGTWLEPGEKLRPARIHERFGSYLVIAPAFIGNTQRHSRLSYRRVVFTLSPYIRQHGRQSISLYYSHHCIVKQCRRNFSVDSKLLRRSPAQFLREIMKVSGTSGLTASTRAQFTANHNNN